LVRSATAISKGAAEIDATKWVCDRLSGPLMCLFPFANVQTMRRILAAHKNQGQKSSLLDGLPLYVVMPFRVYGALSSASINSHDLSLSPSTLSLATDLIVDGGVAAASSGTLDTEHQEAVTVVTSPSLREAVNGMTPAARSAIRAAFGLDAATPSVAAVPLPRSLFDLLARLLAATAQRVSDGVGDQPLTSASMAFIVYRDATSRSASTSLLVAPFPFWRRAVVLHTGRTSDVDSPDPTPTAAPAAVPPLPDASAGEQVRTLPLPLPPPPAAQPVGAGRRVVTRLAASSSLACPSPPPPPPPPPPPQVSMSLRNATAELAARGATHFVTPVTRPLEPPPEYSVALGTREIRGVTPPAGASASLSSPLPNLNLFTAALQAAADATTDLPFPSQSGEKSGQQARRTSSVLRTAIRSYVEDNHYLLLHNALQDLMSDPSTPSALIHGHNAPAAIGLALIARQLPPSANDLRHRPDATTSYNQPPGQETAVQFLALLYARYYYGASASLVAVSVQNGPFVEWTGTLAINGALFVDAAVFQRCTAFATDASLTPASSIRQSQNGPTGATPRASTVRTQSPLEGQPQQQQQYRIVRTAASPLSIPTSFGGPVAFDGRNSIDLTGAQTVLAEARDPRRAMAVRAVGMLFLESHVPEVAKQLRATEGKVRLSEDLFAPNLGWI
jgi:hypothetical protein